MKDLHSSAKLTTLCILFLYIAAQSVHGSVALERVVARQLFLDSGDYNVRIKIPAHSIKEQGKALLERRLVDKIPSLTGLEPDLAVNHLSSPYLVKIESAANLGETSLASYFIFVAGDVIDATVTGITPTSEYEKTAELTLTVQPSGFMYYSNSALITNVDIKANFRLYDDGWRFVDIAWDGVTNDLRLIRDISPLYSNQLLEFRDLALQLFRDRNTDGLLELIHYGGYPKDTEVMGYTLSDFDRIYSSIDSHVFAFEYNSDEAMGESRKPLKEAQRRSWGYSAPLARPYLVIYENGMEKSKFDAVLTALSNNLYTFPANRIIFRIAEVDGEYKFEWYWNK